MRDGYIIHEKTMQQMARLTPEDTAYLMACMSAYYHTGEIDIDQVAETSIAVAVILDDAIERMDADAEAYEKSVEQRRKAAEKRWEKESEPCEDDANDMREDATACDRNAKECEGDAKNAVSVSDSVSVNTKENSPTESKRKKFIPPTVDEVREYCAERNNGIDPEHFVDYYSSQKWKKANGRPVEDWKACVRTWERKETAKPVQPASSQNTRAKPTLGKFGNFPQRDADYNRDMARLIMQHDAEEVAAAMPF